MARKVLSFICGITSSFLKICAFQLELIRFSRVFFLLLDLQNRRLIHACAESSKSSAVDGNDPRSTFTSSLVSMVSGNIWNFLSYYPSAGDLNNDGYPELVYTGWHYAYQGMSATSTPPTSPIWMFSTNNTTTTRIDPTTIIGTNVTYGTTEPRIFDLNRDGKTIFFTWRTTNPLLSDAL